MNALALVRVLVMLRRIWKSIDKANEIAQARLDLEKERLAMEHPSWYKAGRKIPQKGKLTQLGVAEVDTLNQRYRDTHYANEETP